MRARLVVVVAALSFPPATDACMPPADDRNRVSVGADSGECFGDISITPVVASWHEPRDCFRVGRDAGRAIAMPRRHSSARTPSRRRRAASPRQVLLELEITPMRAQGLVQPVGPAPLERGGADTVTGDLLVRVRGTCDVTTGIGARRPTQVDERRDEGHPPTSEQDPPDRDYPRGSAGPTRTTTTSTAPSALPKCFQAAASPPTGRTASPATTGYPQRDSNPRSPA